jgi:hypothetical protein
MNQPTEIEALLVEEAMCLPAEFVVLLTSHGATSDIQLVTRRGEGGLYVTYSAEGARELARALHTAADALDLLAASAKRNAANLN